MDEVLLYTFCHQAIAIIIKDGELSIDKCEEISEEYAKAIFYEIKKSSATIIQDTIQERLHLLKGNLKEARNLYDGGYYIRKAQEIEERRRILLATEESAHSATRSADYAEKANIIAKKSDRKSTIANMIAFATFIITVVFNYCQYRAYDIKSKTDLVNSSDTLIITNKAQIKLSNNHDSTHIEKTDKIEKRND
jgi:hypothetical protein